MKLDFTSSTIKSGSSAVEIVFDDNYLIIAQLAAKYHLASIFTSVGIKMCDAMTSRLGYWNIYMGESLQFKLFIRKEGCSSDIKNDGFTSQRIFVSVIWVDVDEGGLRLEGAVNTKEPC